MQGMVQCKLVQELDTLDVVPEAVVKIGVSSQAVADFRHRSMAALAAADVQVQVVKYMCYIINRKRQWKI